MQADRIHIPRWRVMRVTNVSTGEAVEVGVVRADDVEAAQVLAGEMVGDFQTFRVERIVASTGGEKLPIIGRERALIDGLAKVLQEAAWRGARFAKASHEVSSVRATERGATFEVQIRVDGEPTGHIARVTVELDRFEEPRR